MPAGRGTSPSATCRTTVRQRWRSSRSASYSLSPGGSGRCSREPPADEFKEALESFAILHSDRAILTPHNAFNTREALERILATSIENIRAFFGGNPQNVVAGTYRVPATPPAGGA